MGQGIRRNQNAKVGPDGYGGSTHRAEGSLQRMALASELVVQWWPSIHPVVTRLKDTHPQGLARSLRVVFRLGLYLVTRCELSRDLIPARLTAFPTPV